jgi:hypothetical protein
VRRQIGQAQRRACHDWPRIPEGPPVEPGHALGVGLGRWSVAQPATALSRMGSAQRPSRRSPRCSAAAA